MLIMHAWFTSTTFPYCNSNDITGEMRLSAIFKDDCEIISFFAWTHNGILRSFSLRQIHELLLHNSETSMLVLFPSCVRELMLIFAHNKIFLTYTVRRLGPEHHIHMWFPFEQPVPDLVLLYYYNNLHSSRKAFYWILEHSFRDLCSFRHKSFSEIRHWCQTGRPGAQTTLLFIQKVFSRVEVKVRTFWRTLEFFYTLADHCTQGHSYAEKGWDRLII